MSRTIRICYAATLSALAHCAVAGNIADVITLGGGSGAPGTTVDIPIYVRDLAGTVLGIDQPTGSRIQSYSITVDYSPAAAVQTVTYARAGITASLTPTFESSPSSAGTISAIDTFSESTNLIPFTSNAAAPGDQIGVLHFTLAPAALPGTVTLTLDPTLTQLGNEAGTIMETTTATNLSLVGGSITITPVTPVTLQSFEVK